MKPGDLVWVQVHGFNCGVSNKDADGVGLFIKRIEKAASDKSSDMCEVFRRGKAIEYWATQVGLLSERKNV
jgi:hypothetical protein